MTTSTKHHATEIIKSTVNRWMAEGVRYRDGGRDPRSGLDCWHGVFLLLYRACGIEIEDVVETIKEDNPSGDVAEISLAAYASVARRIDPKSARVGDVIVYPDGKRAHVAVCEDEHWAAHITDRQGVTRTRITDLLRIRKPRIYRYVGPGHQVFD